MPENPVMSMVHCFNLQKMFTVLFHWKEKESNYTKHNVSLEFLVSTFSWRHVTAASFALHGFFSVCLLGAGDS